MQNSAMDSRFEEVITTRERLREIIELPSDRVARKTIGQIKTLASS